MIQTKQILRKPNRMRLVTHLCNSWTLDSGKIEPLENYSNHKFSFPISSNIFLTSKTYTIPEVKNGSFDYFIRLKTFKLELLKRIEHLFKTLDYENWDNYGASPITIFAKQKAIETVRNTEAQIIKHWDVFPARSGSLSFEFKYGKIGALSLNQETFTFAGKNSKGEVIKGKHSYSDMAPSEALKLITELLSPEI